MYFSPLKRVILLIVLIELFVMSAVYGDSILPNGSFEQGEYPSPAPWKYGIWTGKAAFRIPETDGRNGGRCGKIISKKDGVDGGWRAPIPVEPHTTYRLSGWIKTENVKAGSGRGAFLNIHEMEGVRTTALTGTVDWTRAEVCFNTIQRTEVTVNCMLGGWGTSEGVAWYDDICLEVIRTPDEPIAVELDLSRTGHPICPYVYGQLIEHVGKCVYGGMWAEMLEDRKFFFPITDEFVGWARPGEESYTEDAVYTYLKGSPWRVIGPAGTVEMTRENPFVGKQSPRITVKGEGRAYGIQQERLGLTAGREYTGRIFLAGDQTALPITVSLIWGQGDHQRETVTVDRFAESFTEIPLFFTAAAKTDQGRLEISSRGSGHFQVGCVSLMPADNLKGWRSDVLGLLRQLNATIYKWPGGNFVSGYDWRDGIGPRDRRAPLPNPHWKGVEDNDVGVHEFMALCELLNTEPSLAVSSGAGDPQQAAELVEYVNGSCDSTMGKKRTQNGHPEPYEVKLFYVGNEMWGSHQVGYIPICLYTKKHNRMVEAMKAVDSSIRVVAVGRVGSWGEQMLNECAGHMDIISDNFYRPGASDLWNHAASISGMVHLIAEAHRQYRRTLPSLRDKDLPLSIDEWGYWYSRKKYGQIGMQYYLEDAMGIAAGLHEMFRYSDLIEVVHYAQAVNVLGAIKTSPTEAVIDTPGLVLKLYRNHQGSIPVLFTNVTSPLDVFASLSEDRKKLVISVVNATEFEQELEIKLDQKQLGEPAESFVITGEDRKAFNEPGRQPDLEIKRQTLTKPFEILRVAPISVELFEFTLKN